MGRSYKGEREERSSLQLVVGGEVVVRVVPVGVAQKGVAGGFRWCCACACACAYEYACASGFGFDSGSDLCLWRVLGVLQVLWGCRPNGKPRIAGAGGGQLAES